MIFNFRFCIFLAKKIKLSFSKRIIQVRLLHSSFNFKYCFREQFLQTMLYFNSIIKLNETKNSCILFNLIESQGKVYNRKKYFVNQYQNLQIQKEISYQHRSKLCMLLQRVYQKYMKQKDYFLWDLKLLILLDDQQQVQFVNENSIFIQTKYIPIMLFIVLTIQTIKLETISSGFNSENTKEVYIDISQCMQHFKVIEQIELQRNLERNKIDIVIKI
ncbi:unnamed protein product [Paramecium pentaurelia]|uniref:Uncharacterized protein n=1 Tax=Paramecium pentaurelia TaxID=43138 RepID=A0A8S1XS17_9CILI|nr:unnamed protein product [Paramecium pentaurelia]